MKQTKQELKYQANQQLKAKFLMQGDYWWNYGSANVTQLLKKVVK